MVAHRAFMTIELCILKYFRLFVIIICYSKKLMKTLRLVYEVRPAYRQAGFKGEY